MKKKGFTLVELLAVIAILAILVIIALPNVISMYNEAKMNTFVTEARKLQRSAAQQWMLDTSKTTFSSESEFGTKMSIEGNQNLKFYIEVASSGKVVAFVATDGTYKVDIRDDNGIEVQNIGSTEKINNIDYSAHQAAGSYKLEKVNNVIKVTGADKTAK